MSIMAKNKQTWLFEIFPNEFRENTFELTENESSMLINAHVVIGSNSAVQQQLLERWKFGRVFDVVQGGVVASQVR